MWQWHCDTTNFTCHSFWLLSTFSMNIDYFRWLDICHYDIFTSPAGAVAKYCNEHVCVCMSVCVRVCLSASISPETRVIFTKFLCMLSIAVARSSSGGVTQSQGEWTILGVFFPIDNALYRPYSGMNFATKDRFRLNLLIYRKVGQNSISDY